MSAHVYNLLTSVLFFVALVGLGLAAVYLVAAIVAWRGPSRNRRLVRFALLFAVFPICVAIQQSLLWIVFLPSLGREARRETMERSEDSSIVHVGDGAPSFALTTTEGETFALGDHRGKVVLVNFFATWCGPCLMELPHVQEIWDKHREDSGFALIVIGREETADAVNQFRQQHGYTFPLAPDPERSVYSLYAKELIPRTYLVGADGNVCFATTGFDEEDLAALKAEMLKQLRDNR